MKNKYSYLSLIFVLYPIVIGVIPLEALTKLPKFISNHINLIMWSLYGSVLFALLTGVLALTSKLPEKGRWQTLMAWISTATALLLGLSYCYNSFF